MVGRGVPQDQRHNKIFPVATGRTSTGPIAERPADAVGASELVKPIAACGSSSETACTHVDVNTGRSSCAAIAARQAETAREPPPERDGRLPVHRRRAADAAETIQTAWAGVRSGRKRLVTNAVGSVVRMKVEVWSDVVCPWCYIGKRRFETALASWRYSLIRGGSTIGRPPLPMRFPGTPSRAGKRPRTAGTFRCGSR